MFPTTQKVAVRSAAGVLVDVYRLTGGSFLYMPLIADWEIHAERERLSGASAQADKQDDEAFWAAEA